MVDKATIEAAIEFAQLRLPTEKQQIVDAYNATNAGDERADEYYNETYKKAADDK